MATALWAESHDEPERADEDSADAEQDEAEVVNLAARRLRQWLSGMFGLAPKPPPQEPPQRD
jgi:hypothetical protein